MSVTRSTANVSPAATSQFISILSPHQPWYMLLSHHRLLMLTVRLMMEIMAMNNSVDVSIIVTH